MFGPNDLVAHYEPELKNLDVYTNMAPLDNFTFKKVLPLRLN